MGVSGGTEAAIHGVEAGLGLMVVVVGVNGGGDVGDLRVGERQWLDWL